MKKKRKAKKSNVELRKRVLKECTLILGMHRSGTSVLAGLVSILGAYTGSNLMKPTKDNPKGYFENNKIYQLNEKILQENYSSWDDYFFNLQDISPEKIHNYKKLAKEVIQNELKYARTIVIKDPRICILFPIWEQALNELDIKIKIIIAYRSPMEVAQSLHTRDKMHVEKGLILWSHYFFLAEKHSRNYKRFFVHYSDDFYNMESFLEKLTKFTGHTLTPSVLKEAEHFFSPKLKHQNIPLKNISAELPIYLNNLISLLTEQRFDDIEALDESYQNFLHSKQFYLQYEKELEKELNEREEKYNNLKTQLSIIDNKSKDLEAQNKLLINELDISANKSKDLETQNKVLKNELDIFENDSKELETQISVLKEELETQQQKLQLTNEELLHSQKIHDQKLAEIPALLKENERTIKEALYAKQTEEKNDLLKKSQQLLEQKESLFNKKLMSYDKLLSDTAKNKRLKQRIENNLKFPVLSKLKLLLFPPLIFKKSKAYLSERKQIIESGLFSPLFYLLDNSDVLESNMDPLTHYCKYGWYEGRNPSRFFNTLEYLMVNSDVAESEMNPLFHYVKYGQKEGRIINANKKHTDLAFSATAPATNRSKDEKAPAIQEINGDQVVNTKVSSILLVAHSAGDLIYGGERSFFDMIIAASRSEFNIIVVLPRKQLQIIEQIKPHVAKIVVASYGWWKKDVPVYQEIIQLFSSIIQKHDISIIHVNTIMLREPLLAAKLEGIPSIIHIRELITGDKTLSLLIGESIEKIVSNVVKSSDFIVANSQETANAFLAKHKTTVIHNTVDTNLFDIENKVGKLLKVGLISSNIEKKGIYEFIKIAEICKNTENVHFVLIGPETGDVKKAKLIAKEKSLKNLTFAGYKKSPIEAISQLNVVLNISKFTESFGRTVMEGMAGRRPVIAYRWGAIKELICDGETGYLVPYMDIEAVSEKIMLLNKDRSLLLKMGQLARKRAVHHFSLDIYTDKVIHLYKKIINQSLSTNFNIKHKSLENKNQLNKTVCAIIPNYNYELFLPERLNSIISQTMPPDEIIFLDDASSDNSVEVARAILENSQIPFKIIENNKNKGVYKQWLRGISEAKSDWIWLAEADDACESDFLLNLKEKAVANVNIVYCQSKKIDEHSNVIVEKNLAHTNDLDEKRWLEDYVEVGVREVVDWLVYRNTIPNASATLLRKSAISGVEKHLNEYRYCGDWLLYTYMLRTGKISYVSRPLNHFRRHQLSVTNKQSKTVSYLKELIKLREYIIKNFPVLPRQKERLDWFLDRDYKINGVNKNSQYYSKKLKNICIFLENRKRILFITTNNGSYYGGSEMLWQETAIKLRELGHDVLVLIKNWQPAPVFFREFEAIGIKLFFKENVEFKKVISLKPDIAIVSIGDQDEGIEYYPALKQSNIPYVIINQLTKEERYWPIRKQKLKEVKNGYLNAQRIFFTCWNNHRVMQDRLGCKIESAEIHTNPYHIDRNIIPPFPKTSNGFQIAVPAKILFIHKGQDIIVDVMKEEHWKSRDITLNFYGDGPDRQRLEDLAKENGINCFKFHGRIADISKIWEKNHAFVLASRMEGLPIMLVSGMLSARVPIVTNIGGHAEVVEDNISGFIAKDPTVKELDYALEQAYLARNDWEEIGKNARKSILNFLPEDPVVDFTKKIFIVAKEVESSNTAIF